VADAAALHRYNELGGPKTKTGDDSSFARRMKWLVHEAAIAEADQPRWDAYRRLRNIGSHPSVQTLQRPGDALHALRVVAGSVIELFAIAQR
jgi:hypothetical protein